jgi:hypothetical protein
MTFAALHRVAAVAKKSSGCEASDCFDKLHKTACGSHHRQMVDELDG